MLTKCVLLWYYHTGWLGIKHQVTYSGVGLKKSFDVGLFFKIPFNNNNRLFMAPHLIRAQSAYKHIRIHSFHHTHKHTHTWTCVPAHPPTHTDTHNKYMHYCWWTGKMRDQYAEEKGQVFNFHAHMKRMYVNLISAFPIKPVHTKWYVTLSSGWWCHMFK